MLNTDACLIKPAKMKSHSLEKRHRWHVAAARNTRAIPGRAVATALWTAEKSISRDRWIQRLLTLPPLEKLNGALVFRRRSLGLERAKISAFPRLWIFLPRIQSILTGFQFPDHYVASLGGLSFDFNVPIGLTSPDFDTADAAPSRDY